MRERDLPIPSHFDAARVGKVWRVAYEDRAAEARSWAREHDITPAADDDRRACLLLVDVQNTFCIPDFELFVAGRSGTGAVDDNRRLCEFVYRNLGSISRMTVTLDTHRPIQIFHAIFFVDADGRHPPPFTLITAEDVESGRWRGNPAAAAALGETPESLQKHLSHYARALRAGDRYALTIWPYHAMLGGIGHALVSAVEEAVFFHSVARVSQPDFQVKGDNPLTESYSVLGPEVLSDAVGRPVAHTNHALIRALNEYDAVIVAGQAKSHCVAWTVSDLLDRIVGRLPDATGKVYLLEDCTSPVVVPDTIDYTAEADAAFGRFRDAGMHVVRSTTPLSQWPGILGHQRVFKPGTERLP
jgi:nicotinamidase-related amidase